MRSASLERVVLIDVPWRDVRALAVHSAGAAPRLRVLEVRQTSSAVAPDAPLDQASPVGFLYACCLHGAVIGPLRPIWRSHAGMPCQSFGKPQGRHLFPILSACSACFPGS